MVYSVAAINTHATKREEGWGLFDVDSTGILEIEKDDDLGRFRWDETAVAFVRRRAKAGSKLHQRALAIHLRDRKARLDYRHRRGEWA